MVRTSYPYAHAHANPNPHPCAHSDTHYNVYPADYNDPNTLNFFNIK